MSTSASACAISESVASLSSNKSCKAALASEFSDAAAVTSSSAATFAVSAAVEALIALKASSPDSKALVSHSSTFVSASSSQTLTSPGTLASSKFKSAANAEAAVPEVTASAIASIVFFIINPVRS